MKNIIAEDSDPEEEADEPPGEWDEAQEILEIKKELSQQQSAMSPTPSQNEGRFSAGHKQGLDSPGQLLSSQKKSSLSHNRTSPSNLERSLGGSQQSQKNIKTSGSHFETKSNLAPSNEDEEKQITSVQNDHQENSRFQKQMEETVFRSAGSEKETTEWKQRTPKLSVPETKAKRYQNENFNSERKSAHKTKAGGQMIPDLFSMNSSIEKTTTMQRGATKIEFRWRDADLRHAGAVSDEDMEEQKMFVDSEISPINSASKRQPTAASASQIPRIEKNTSALNSLSNTDKKPDAKKGSGRSMLGIQPSKMSKGFSIRDEEAAATAFSPERDDTSKKLSFSMPNSR